MAEEKTQGQEAEAPIHTIEVHRSTRATLDLLTRKRSFELVTKEAGFSHPLDGEGCGLWVEICEEAGDSQQPQEKVFLHLEEDVDTRDGNGSMDAETAHRYPKLFKERLRCRRDSDDRDFGISISDLYRIAEGSHLKAHVLAPNDRIAELIWLTDYLRILHEGKEYKCLDMSDIMLFLKPVMSGDGATLPDGKDHDREASPARTSDFETFDVLYGMLEGMATDKYGQSYGDDILVDFEIACGERSAHWCVTEFYSNHNWNIDPLNLLQIRFTTAVLNEPCSEEEALFCHPTKASCRKPDNAPFLLWKMLMENDASPKFGKGDAPAPEDEVSADRVMDNLIDFISWLEMHHKEIELL